MQDFTKLIVWQKAIQRVAWVPRVVATELRSSQSDNQYLQVNVFYAFRREGERKAFKSSYDDDLRVCAAAN